MPDQAAADGQEGGRRRRRARPGSPWPATWPGWAIEVTIFEALHKPGGVLVYGIPEFRLPKAIVQREVDYLAQPGRRAWSQDYVIGKTATVDELLEELRRRLRRHGRRPAVVPGHPGENLSGVYSANEYLTRSNLMKAYRFPEYDTPVVRGTARRRLGGGNVAMDAARTALRLGAEESIIVYRRSREEMPARPEEIHHAEQEGIEFMTCTTPVRILGDDQGRVTELECLRKELGEPDASGRRRPVPIPGTKFRIPADIVIVAIGQSPNPLIPRTTADLTTKRDGVVVIDETTGKTSKRGVFAGGDIVTGGATVILAMGQGRIAATAIDEYLKTGVW